MANTPVEVRAPSGLSLTLELYPYGSDTLANTGGDALSEATNRKGLYTATVTEPLAGWHTAHVKQGSAIVAVYDIFLADTTDVQRCEDAPIQLHRGGATIEPVTLAASESVYPADIQLTIDNISARDEYTVTWFQNGSVVTSGITSPTIEVVRRADGSTLIAAGTPMSPIANTGGLKYDEPTNRLSPDEAVLVTVSATINGGTRTWRRIVTRDTQS